MSDDLGEPFIIVDRGAGAAPSPGRLALLGGRKPGLLLVDRGGSVGAGLELPLAEEGFEVYRTTARESALDLLEAHPSVLLALVGTDLPNADAALLLRDLSLVRPGLWIGLVCEPGDRDRGRLGYASGAADLLWASAPVALTAERLVRSLPWALRLREDALRRLERRRVRASLPWYRRGLRRSRNYLGAAARLGAALVLGGLLAAATRAWEVSREQEEARIERQLRALETVRPFSDRGDRQFDRWQRQERLDLDRESQRALGAYHQAELEEDRLRDLLRLAAPHYGDR